jgi:O-antigen/teichoic acid export membrane protein
VEQWRLAMLKHNRNRRMVMASSAGGVQRVVAAVCTLVVMPVLLHALGTNGFGVWGAAASLAWLVGLADFGTSYALVTLVARSVARDEIAEARREIGGGLTQGGYLTALLLAAAGLVWLCGGLRGASSIYLIALVALALNVPLHSASNIFMALQEGYHSSLWELVQTLLTAGGLLLATLFTRDVRLYVAIVYGGLVASNVGCMIHLFVAHPELRPERLPLPWAAVREVASVGTMFFLMLVAGMLSYALDNVLALQLLGPAASAQMAIAMRICITVVGVLVVVSQPLWPAFTDAAHRDDRGWILHNAVRSGALLVGVSVAGCAVLVLFGERLLRLWLHTNLGIGRPLLWAVAGWILAWTLVRIPFLLLNGLSLVRFQTVLFAIATAIALALKFVLAKPLGVPGILWATSAAVLLIVFPASLWRLWHWARHPEEKESLTQPPPAEEPAGHLY